MLRAIGGFFGGGFVTAGVLLFFIPGNDPSVPKTFPLIFLVVGAFICSLTYQAKLIKQDSQTIGQYVTAHLKALIKGVGVYFAIGFWIVFAILGIMGPSGPRKSIGSWIEKDIETDEETVENLAFYWDYSKEKFFSSSTGLEIPLKNGVRKPESYENPETDFQIDSLSNRMIRI